MKTANKTLAMILVAAAGMLGITARASDSDQEILPTTKQERNLIREGNSLYRQKRFAEAEVKYRKALEEVPQSETALFNLAASLIRQSGSADPNSGNNPIKDASEILRQLGKDGFDTNLSGKAFYNLGKKYLGAASSIVSCNIAFNNNDFAGAVDMYKHSLRKNPDDDKARQNLRIAQKKLEQQQQDQQNNQDKQNQDQQQDQNQQQDQDDQSHAAIGTHTDNRKQYGVEIRKAQAG